MPKMFRFVLIALACGAFSLSALAASPAATASAGAASGGDPVVARVNGMEIHRSDVMQEIQLMGPQASQVPPQMLYPEVLNKMIATKLVSAQGYSEKLQDTPEAKAELKDAEAQIVAQMYVKKSITPKITEAKIKERYDELAAKYKPQEEVKASHILITAQSVSSCTKPKDECPPPTAEDWAKAEAKAEDIIKQLKGGADFAKLAGEESRDTGSAKQGGDLGWFTHDVMVKEFADAAFAMKPGEISDKPVKTSFGYHVIKVVDKRKSSPPPIADVHDQIANQIGQEMTQQLVKDLEAKAKVEKFNIDGTPMKAADATTKK